MSQILNIEDESSKIDSQATRGLLGVEDSLAYRVAVIERHLHSTGRWIETAATSSGETHVCDRIGEGAGSFQLDGGNNTWGAWVQLCGSDDTPIQDGKLYFDPHQVIVEDSERASVYFIQIGRGDSGAAILSAGTYTEFVYSATVQKDTGIISVQSGRAPAGSKLWGRCWSVGHDTGTINFFIGLHEYEG